MKAPEPLYPCHFCNEEYSWPASDLAWSERYQDWVCGECWCACHDDDYEPDERGQRLREFLREQQEAELATLRAKAEAYDKGVEAWEIMDEVGEQVGLGRSRVDAILDHLRGRVPLEDLQSEWLELEDQGYTCRKVRVCEVAAAGEKPALATNEKERL